MGKLVFAALASLDGYIEDTTGGFDWAEPDPEVHAFANDLERHIGTAPLRPPHVRDDGRLADDGRRARAAAARRTSPRSGGAWTRSCSPRTLDDVWTPRTRLEREFDADAVRRLKEAADRDLSVSGPGLAQHAFEAGLVDGVHLFLSPVAVGGGKPALPQGVRLDLELVDEHRFSNGVVHLHHRTVVGSGE